MIEIDSNNHVIVHSEEPDNCELCGTHAELRPYGPNRARICAPCSQKDRETTYRFMNEALMQSLDDKGIDLLDVKRIAYERADGSEVVLLEVLPSPNGLH